MRKLAYTLLLPSLILGCSVDEPANSMFEVKDFSNGWVDQPCAESTATKNAYFGDLHVHTSYSSDAFSFDVRLTPDDAYRYAFGETVMLPPLDEQGNSTRPTKIDRPIDFMGVTDHAEFLGEQLLCVDPSSKYSQTEACEVFHDKSGRAFGLLTKIAFPWSARDEELCGEDGLVCDKALRSRWTETIETAQKWDDASPDCTRTAFNAYEYSSFRQGSNLHRNVIFKNDRVPMRPVSYLDRHREWGLWETLRSECVEGDAGCDAIAIPHNSNISNGRMFNIDYIDTDGIEEQAARARLRMQIEPIIEIMQHKGDSECRNGLAGVGGGSDELCDFEKFENFSLSRTNDDPNEAGECVTGDWAWRLGPSCLDRLSYARHALVAGLAEYRRIGVNPFKFGISASTDTHNGLGGGVEEKSFAGHLGRGDDALVKRATYDKKYAGNASNNPGGLIGVWAPENSRSALFESMRSKEVFGTSGPRIEPRLFAAWQLNSSLCSDPEMLQKAYASAVPMGQDLPEKSSAAPQFLVSAKGDTGTPMYPGMPLQRLQIIKGWADENDIYQQRTYDVAGGASDASVDPETCETSGAGFAQLCSVWTDPEFDESIDAVYYARAVENPTCRYNAWQCSQARGTDRPAICDDDTAEKVIQERAWTSPIWYTAQ